MQHLGVDFDHPGTGIADVLLCAGQIGPRLLHPLLQCEVPWTHLLADFQLSAQSSDAFAGLFYDLVLHPLALRGIRLQRLRLALQRGTTRFQRDSALRLYLAGVGETQLGLWLVDGGDDLAAPNRIAWLDSQRRNDAGGRAERADHPAALRHQDAVRQYLGRDAAEEAPCDDCCCQHSDAKRCHPTARVDHGNEFVQLLRRCQPIERGLAKHLTCRLHGHADAPAGRPAHRQTAALRRLENLDDECPPPLNSVERGPVIGRRQGHRGHLFLFAELERPAKGR